MLMWMSEIKELDERISVSKGSIFSIVIKYS